MALRTEWYEYGAILFSIVVWFGIYRIVEYFASIRTMEEYLNVVCNWEIKDSPLTRILLKKIQKESPSEPAEFKICKINILPFFGAYIILLILMLWVK